MIGEILGVLFQILIRFIGQIFVDTIIGLLIKGPGYLIVNAISKQEPDPDSFWIIVIGLLFWIIVSSFTL